MQRSTSLALCIFVSISIAVIPTTSDAVLPVLLGKELLKNIVFGQVRDQMIGSLANMGCKGARLAGVIASASVGNSPGRGGLSGGMSGALPGMPGGLPGGARPPGSGMTPLGNMGVPPTGGASMRAARGGVGIPNATPEQAQAMMRSGMPDPSMFAQVPGMSPEQAAQMQSALANMQEAMSHPLSRAETVGVFDEMASLGLLTNEMRGEARDCILLAPAGSDDAIGAAGALMKNMVLPALRDTKARLASLTPEERNQLIDGLVDGLREASPQDRKLFLDGFGAGFFPAPVVEGVRAKMAER